MGPGRKRAQTKTLMQRWGTWMPGASLSSVGHMHFVTRRRTSVSARLASFGERPVNVASPMRCRGGLVKLVTRWRIAITTMRCASQSKMVIQVVHARWHAPGIAQTERLTPSRFVFRSRPRVTDAAWHGAIRSSTRRTMAAAVDTSADPGRVIRNRRACARCVCHRAGQQRARAWIPPTWWEMMNATWTR
jgi:hypothetical protein